MDRGENEREQKKETQKKKQRKQTPDRVPGADAGIYCSNAFF